MGAHTFVMEEGGAHTFVLRKGCTYLLMEEGGANTFGMLKGVLTPFGNVPLLHGFHSVGWRGPRWKVGGRCCLTELAVTYRSSPMWWGGVIGHTLVSWP